MYMCTVEEGMLCWYPLKYVREHEDKVTTTSGYDYIKLTQNVILLYIGDFTMHINKETSFVLFEY